MHINGQGLNLSINNNSIIINGKEFKGNDISVETDGIFIDGVNISPSIPNNQSIKIFIQGNVDNVTTTNGSIDIVGNVNTVNSVNGNIQISGSVHTTSTTTGNITNYK